MIMLIVNNILGINPGQNFISFKPRLLPGITGVKGCLPLRGRKFIFDISSDANKLNPIFKVNGKNYSVKNNQIKIPFTEDDIEVVVF